ncbi:MAG: response regulator transcription factor [Rhodospirillales bacterium]|nr:response regulator transcription factor [Rhodospirillales bacterium]
MINTLNILLLEDCVEDTCLIRNHLRNSMKSPFQLIHFRKPEEVSTYLACHRQDVDIVLMDVSPFKQQDGEAMHREFEEIAPDLPMIVIGPHNYDMALSYVAGGAEDYISFVHMAQSSQLLRNKIEFALKRHRILSNAIRKARHDLAEKQQIISWLSGSYSVENNGY